WHCAKIQQAEGRKTVLLSHHQLFSAFEPIGGEAINQQLLATFQTLLGNVAIWFWGHEHRLDIYAPYQGLQRGRCLGCSAIPVFTADDPGQLKFPDVPLLQDPPGSGVSPRLGNDGTLYRHAYAIVKL